MAFALVPEGFKLQKVTKAQQQAIDKYYSSKNIEAFLEGSASSELVKTVSLVVTPIVLSVLAKYLIDLAKKENINLDDITLDRLTKAAVRSNPVLLLADIGFNLAGKVDIDAENKIKELLTLLSR